jgi:hypothetical protein
VGGGDTWTSRDVSTIAYTSSTDGSPRPNGYVNVGTARLDKICRDCGERESSYDGRCVDCWAAMSKLNKG